MLPTASQQPIAELNEFKENFLKLIMFLNLFPEFFVTFARKDNSLRINRLVGLLENWVMR